MKNYIYKGFAFSFLSLAIVSCQPEQDLPQADKGTADFTTYVSLGDGTPSGYASGALTMEGQLSCFPNILAKQFKLVGGGDFNQPLIEAGIGYGFENGKAAAVLALRDSTFCNGDVELYPIEMGVRTQSDVIDAVFTNDNKVFNNLAAQGTRSIYINKDAKLGGEWPGTSWIYANKVLDPEADNFKILQHAVDLNPTFFTLYFGSIDVFRYAKSGGNQEVPLGPTNDDFITPVGEFESSLRSTVTALVANGAKGAIINLIDAESFPYITHYKYDDLVLTDDEAIVLNEYYKTDGFTFNEGRNAYVIEDSTAANGRRRIKANEYVLIQRPTDSIKCFQLGAQVPLGKRWVLDEFEIGEVNKAVISFNIIIKNIADEFGLAFVDSNETTKRNLAGQNVSGIDTNQEFVTGGIVSLDGLNLSPRGQVLLANNVIKAINEKFEATIPYADISNVPGITFDK